MHDSPVATTSAKLPGFMTTRNRRRFVNITVMATLLWSGGNCLSPLAADDDPLSFLRNVLNERQSIRFGTIYAEMDYEIDKGRVGYEGLKREIVTEFYAECDWRRQDQQLVHPNWTRRVVTLVNDIDAIHVDGRDGLHATYNPDYRSGSNDPEDSRYARFATYDFRYLGFVASPSDLSRSFLDEFRVGWASNAHEHRNDTVLQPDGTMLQRHIFSGANESEIEVLTDPNRDNVPLSIRSVYETVSYDIVTSYQAVEAIVDDFGTESVSIWFPEEVVHTVTVDGEIKTKEVVRILACDFVTPPEISRFQISSLLLPEGRRIDSTDGWLMVIDNFELRKVTSSDVWNAARGMYTLRAVPR